MPAEVLLGRHSLLPGGLEFINDHLKRENAFVPFFEPTDHARGERHELTIEGFGPDDVERLDYVAL